MTLSDGIVVVVGALMVLGAGAVMLAVVVFVVGSTVRRVSRTSDRTVGGGNEARQAVAMSLDPTFMGDALVMLFIDKFKLTPQELAALTAGLQEDLREPAPFWLVLYACWLTREQARTLRGDDFAGSMMRAAQRRFAVTTPDLDGRQWFAAIDDAFGRFDDACATWRERGGPMQLELFVARALLTLDGNSPYRGQIRFPLGIDTQLASCLSAARHRLDPMIRAMVQPPGSLDNAAAKTAEGISESPGPRERHLWRRKDNLLFPAARRHVTSEDVAEAKHADAEELRRIHADVSAFLKRLVDGPDVLDSNVTFAELNRVKELRSRSYQHGTVSALEAADLLGRTADDMLQALRRTADAHGSAGAALHPHIDSVERMLEIQKGKREFFRELMNVPPADLPSTVCALEPERIRVVAAMYAGNDQEDGWLDLRRQCIERLQSAVKEGYPDELADVRFRALGHGTT